MTRFINFLAALLISWAVSAPAMAQSEPAARDYPDWWYEIQEISAGSSTTVTIEDRDWYVLEKDGTKCLIWMKDIESTWGTNGVRRFAPRNVAQWSNSYVRSWLNDTYIKSLTTLNKHVQETEISTRSKYRIDSSDDFIYTTDLVFLLSLPDLSGTYYMSSSRGITVYEQDYTYNNKRLVSAGHAALKSGSKTFWLRNPYSAGSSQTNTVAFLTTSGGVGYASCNVSYAIRPAMWIDLAAEVNYCGDNLTWSISEGTLTIEGYGPMWNYEYDVEKTTAPWADSTFTNVVFPEEITYIGTYAFHGRTALTELDLPALLDSIGNYAFSGCTSLTSVDLSNCAALTSIGNYAFSGCSSLASISFPASLTSIGNNAFVNCTGLASVNLFGSLESIGNYAFSNCAGLRTLDLSDCTKLTSIGEYVFYAPSGTSLKTAALPASLDSIGRFAFGNCSALESIVVSATTPPALDFYGFDGVDKEACTLYVPDSSVDTYKAASYWRTFFNIQPMSELSERDGEEDSASADTDGSEGGEENTDGTESNEGDEEDGTGLNTATLASKVSVNGLEVELSVAAGTQVRVYSVLGHLVLNTTQQRFTLPSAGVYIIAAGGETTKVVARP